VEHLKGASLGYDPALPVNIRLGWKGLSGTNALAYYEKSYLTDVKHWSVIPVLGTENCRGREVKRRSKLEAETG
jgi:hypothetical protein